MASLWCELWVDGFFLIEYNLNNLEDTRKVSPTRLCKHSRTINVRNLNVYGFNEPFAMCGFHVILDLLSHCGIISRLLGTGLEILRLKLEWVNGLWSLL